MKNRLKKLALIAVLLPGLMFLSAVALARMTNGPSVRDLTVQTTTHPEFAESTDRWPVKATDTFRVISLNIAHGRRTRFHQALIRKKTIRRHLTDIAELLDREQAHIVALQECDGDALWSGSTHQASFLAEDGLFPFFVHGRHVKGMKLDYGTALLSKFQLGHAASVTFRPTPPTFSKGFVIATVIIPLADSVREVDVVSVHLDFSRRTNRSEQVERMIKELAGHDRPLIVTGDLNSEWNWKDSAVQRLVKGLKLKAFEPRDAMPTSLATGHRLDWILISGDMDFVRYEVLPDRVSDHQPLLAELRFR